MDLQKKENEERVSQEQLYDMLTSKEVSWKAILLDLIKTEQLDPWDVDISLLVDKYLEKIYEIEELNFFISSKILLAAALLLRIKSELLRSSVRDVDEILFGKKEEQIKEKEIIEINEDEIPLIIPRSPLPRSRKVTLNELLTALNHAMKTEYRRIKKELVMKKMAEEAKMVLPRKNYVDIRVKIRELYTKIKSFFVKNREIGMTYSDLAGTNREEIISCFLPVLQLTNSKKINLQQDEPFEEIFIWLRQIKKINKLADKTQELKENE